MSYGITVPELRVIRAEVLARRCTRCDRPLPSLMRTVCPPCLFTAKKPWPSLALAVPRATCPTCDRRVLVRKSTGMMGRHKIGVSLHQCPGEGQAPAAG